MSTARAISIEYNCVVNLCSFAPATKEDKTAPSRLRRGNDLYF